MGLRRGLVSMARVVGLVALALGIIFSVRGVTRNGLSFFANPASADDSSNAFFLPVVLNQFARDDMLFAESNLPVQSVSAGYAHACAVRLDGSLICWGLNQHGQASPPPGAYTQVAAGANHTCALRGDGTAVCWGDNTHGQTDPPPGAFIQIDAGAYHTCGIRADGALACWGWNGFQQLVGIPAGSFTQVSAGSLHTCALSADGAARCWGWNADGQIAAPAGTFSGVSAGGAHSCAVNLDGSLACWGSNLSGELNAPAGSFRDVGAGDFHSCGLSAAGEIQCWGSNGFGQLNDIPSGVFRQISVGGQHTCAIREAGGTLACWGWNRYGQSFPPSGVLVSAGRDHACAVRVDGSLNCWGANDFGQADPPDGAYTRVASADSFSCAVRSDGRLACWGRDTDSLLMPPFGTYVDVYAGGQHACALDLMGNISCWGRDDDGKSSPPQGVFSMVGVGVGHTCALRAEDGALVCWGSNSAGQSTPPAGTFTQVSAGLEHTCGRSVFGALSCWGANGSGQADAPTGSYAQVSAGWLHTCGIRADGQTRCWGANDAGESSVPPGDFAQISAGLGFTCAVTLNGEIACWGDPAAAPRVDLFAGELPGAQVGLDYAFTLTASGGEPPYTFSVVSGALPDGLTLSPDGLLSGVPEAQQQATFSISAVDSSQPRFAGQREYSLTVLPRQVSDVTPPVIEAEIDGPLGMNGWHTGPVSVTWRVFDAESPVSASDGCGPTALRDDTPGVTLTCAAESAGGAASSSVTVKIDQTPPENVRGLPETSEKSGWYNRPITVNFIGSDPTSGIAACTSAVYSGPDAAPAAVFGTCADNAGNVSPAAVFQFGYDATPPTLDPRVVPNPVYLNGAAQVAANAADNLSGVVEVICEPLDTSAVGQRSAACAAADAAGNRAQASASYTVIYRFAGFFPPLENLPAVNRAVAGQTIPIKFELLDDNFAPVTGLQTVTIRVEEIGCTAGLYGPALEEVYLGGEDTLMNTGGGSYHFNWQTSKDYGASCKAVSVDLGEGEPARHVFLVEFRQ